MICEVLLFHVKHTRQPKGTSYYRGSSDSEP